ncbi:tetratricopeptide repeat protein [Streptomyces sp. NPDC059568]|uniref:tetratricopeptide repeat protein n=1 Tax=unclassified Streptomyces TaxID=2593676 RepID=UPI00366694E1
MIQALAKGGTDVAIQESGRAEALLSAMFACGTDPESPAWRELAHIVEAAAPVDHAVARLWPMVEAGTAIPAEPASTAGATRTMRQLAVALDTSALRDPAMDAVLTDWLRRHSPPTERPTHTNSIGGAAILHGPSVQARDIHGGIHIYQPPRQDSPRPPVPRQLPPVRTQLVDRDRDMRALDILREQGTTHAPQLLVVTGFAGVGKTTLVSHWLHKNASNFPDGQLYADLGGHSAAGEGSPVRAAAVLEGFLYALGAPSVPVDTTQRIALWRSLTSGLRLAVFLDNAYTAAQVRPLLLGTPTGLTVVTSRNHLTGLLVDGAAVHRLSALTPESAVELLTLGGGGKRVAQDPEAAREVVTLCACLPLAVCLAAAQLAVRPHRSLSALAESLAQGQGSLDALRVDGEAVVRTALDVSYGLLPRDSAKLYRQMGLVPTDRYDLFMLTAIGGGGTTDTDAVDRAVDNLINANLLEETGPETYRFHDLVRPHARRLGEAKESASQRERTLRRFVDWCLSTATTAESILTPSHRMPMRDSASPAVVPTPLAGPAEALDWLDTHRNGLMGAVRHCAHAGWHDSCWQLVDAMWPLFLRLRPSGMWIEAHYTGLSAARTSGSRVGAGRMLTSGAIGLRDAGRYAEAADWYVQALEQATSDGDVRQQAQAVNGLGHISLLTSRLDEAREHFEHALRLRESIGYRRGAALSRRRLGETAFATGDYRTAARHLAQAYAELEVHGEAYEAARTLALLGHVLACDGDHEGGTRRLREALGMFRAPGARSEHWEARSLEWLGQAAQRQGDTEHAGRWYEAARDLFRRLNPTDTQRLDDRLRQL